jgi:hypothetical protein
MYRAAAAHVEGEESESKRRKLWADFTEIFIENRLGWGRHALKTEQRQNTMSDFEYQTEVNAQDD